MFFLLVHPWVLVARVNFVALHPRSFHILTEGKPFLTIFITPHRIMFLQIYVLHIVQLHVLIKSRPKKKLILEKKLWKQKGSWDHQLLVCYALEGGSLLLLSAPPCTLPRSPSCSLPLSYFFVSEELYIEECLQGPRSKVHSLFMGLVVNTSGLFAKRVLNYGVGNWYDIYNKA